MDRTRSPRRRALALLAAAALAAAGTTAVARTSVPPVVASDSVDLVMNVPEAAGAIAMKFSTTDPLLFLSTAKGIHTYDVSDPTLPVRKGYLPMVIEQNEGMSLAERPGGVRFVLIGSNGAVVGLNGTTPDSDTSSKKVFVVDVTDVTKPTLVASLPTPTRTHTVSCGSLSCEYAYSDGRAGDAMSIVDLTDFRAPKLAGTFKSVVPGGHDEDLDETGILWHVGLQGSVALDISNPVKPVQLNSTNGAAMSTSDYTGKPWNNFIHHNSYRPNASKFTNDRDALGKIVPKDPATASLANGDVFLVTEEDYLNTTGSGTGRCGDYEGSFQTWHIPFLDADKYKSVNPLKQSGKGTMTPLDRWNTEVLSSGTVTPAGGFCSAHYFDYSNAGFVAQGWYQQGTRILDVRNPKDIKQVGYFFTGATETWASYWVPPHIAKGQTLVYTADAMRGIDVLRVRLPGAPPAATEAVVAPILPQWTVAGSALAPATSRPSKDWGWACRLAGL